MTATQDLAGKLTQKQIADQLGVSRQLVGFALRGEGRMSEELRQKILEAARANGYHQYSNREARAMVSRRYGKRAASGVMAVMFKATFEDQPLSSVPFFVPFFQGLESAAIQRGVDLVLCPLRPQELPRLVREGHVDGVACLLTREEITRRLQELVIPTVNIMPAVGDPEEMEGAPSLLVDSPGGMELATKHLIELGHRRIAYFGSPNPESDGSWGHANRFAGYRRSLLAHGLPLDESLIDMELEDLTGADGAAAMRRLLARHGSVKPGSGRSPGFSALICHNDPIGMGAIRVLQEVGWRVPEDVSVVGFDDVSLQYSFRPALTSICFPRQEMGERALNLLCELSAIALNGRTAEEPPWFSAPAELFPVELVRRETSGPVPHR